MKPELQSASPFTRPGDGTVTLKSVLRAFAATALFRIWEAVLFLSLWATAVVLIHNFVWDGLQTESTLLTVFGVCIGFIIAFRATTASDRYSEGRQLWSQIVNGTRLFSRCIWLHVPDQPHDHKGDHEAAKNLIEKRTIINLLLAFSRALKHYLRGEDGIYYEDLYPLIAYLPRYMLPSGIPRPLVFSGDDDEDYEIAEFINLNNEGLPLHTGDILTSSPSPQRSETLNTITSSTNTLIRDASMNSSDYLKSSLSNEWEKQPQGMEHSEAMISETDTPQLLPARNPPNESSLSWKILRWFIKTISLGTLGAKKSSKKAMRKALQDRVVSHNIPLEITIYLSSYINKLQRHKLADDITIAQCFDSLNTLVRSLTGLERILTTPIPWSYSFHIWTTTWLYLLLLPFQIVGSFGYVTIPATFVLAFAFMGFLTIGEEIENPFGYDDNDLPLDFFINEIIERELISLTSSKAPNPRKFTFVKHNKPLNHFDNRNAEELSKLSTAALYKLFRQQAYSSALNGPKKDKLRRRASELKRGRDKTN